MRWKIRVLVPVSMALIYIITSFFVKIVPCQISPNVPNPIYSWGLCSLNPDLMSPFGVQNIYWGISSQLTDTYIISLIIVFILVFGVITALSRSKHTKTKKEEKQ